MNQPETERRKRLAAKLTWFSLFILLIGGAWAWLIVHQGGPEALGALLPLFIVGAVHLMTGPIALFQAFYISRQTSSPFVTIYFAVYLSLPLIFFPPEVISYVILFILLALVPIGYTLFAAALKKKRK